VSVQTIVNKKIVTLTDLVKKATVSPKDVKKAKKEPKQKLDFTCDCCN